MANMYPKNIAEYLPEDSEKVVYYALKSQLPETFDVFYSVKWTTYEKGQCIQSEADFIVASPEYGFLCLEVKGGNDIVIDEDNHWTLIDHTNGDRHLSCSPYDQAEKSMYYFEKNDSQHIKFNFFFGINSAITKIISRISKDFKPSFFLCRKYYKISCATYSERRK